MDDLSLLEGWAAPLIAKLQPKARRALARKIAIEVRKEQRDRIKLEQAPDGTSYKPRSQSKSKRGEIKRRAMFSKIRTARFMKTVSNASGAIVEYTGRNARIAAVHQYGRMDYVRKGSPLQVRYPTRALLGISPKTRTIVEQALVEHLNL